MITALKTLWQDEDGLTSVEYALIMGAICLCCVSAWSLLGAHVKTTVNFMSGTLLAAR